MDPFTIAALGTGAKVAGGISSALSTLKSAREIAKDSKDSALKDKISDAYDALLDLRESLHDLQTENEALRQQLKQRTAVTRTRDHGYYFADGDPDPLCPRCYERDGRLIHLEAQYVSRESGEVSRWCSICEYSFTEKRGTSW